MPTLPTYSFLPWARQGIGNEIREADTLGASNGTTVERAELEATLELQHTALDNTTGKSNITKTVKMVGPGDLSGVHVNAIVRVHPAAGVGNFEPNGLAYIEFYEEDFPWRYTPAAPAGTGSSSKLRPWLALIALKDDEYSAGIVPGGLNYISIKPAAFNTAFHHQSDHWAFAHVHINKSLTNTSGASLQTELNTELSADPDVAVSRLLCPRKLQKNTAYTCFLIPAFETGRLNGLGLETNNVAAQTPSWKKGAMPASALRPYDFPVYHQWRFLTGVYGDFESLATLLKPNIIAADQGKIPMDIRKPGYQIAAGTSGTPAIGFESALKPVNMTRDPWPGTGAASATDQTNIQKLRQLLNLSADFVDPAVVIDPNTNYFNAPVTSDPILVPPVYGVWHAMAQKLGNAGNPPWLEELNLDFRNRAAAGIGASIVQEKQDDLVDRAWQQVNKVNEANRKIEEARMAQMVNAAIMKKNIVNGGADKALLITDPVQHLVKNQANTQTVQQDFTDSRVPNAAKSAAFRKIARPVNKTAGAARIHFKTPTAPLLVNNNNIVNRFNLDESAPAAVRSAKLKPSPMGSLHLGTINSAIIQAVNQYNGDPNNVAKDKLVELIKDHVITPGVTLTRAQLLNLANTTPISLPAARTVLVNIVNNITDGSTIGVNAYNQVDLRLNHALFIQLFDAGVKVKFTDGVVLRDAAAPAGAPVNGLATIGDLLNIQQNFNLFSVKTLAQPEDNQGMPVSSFSSITSHLLARLSPEQTLMAKMAATIKVFNGTSYQPLNAFKPIMAHPEFQEPIYEYLLKLSKNYILPNIDKLPNNSVAVLQNNQSFVEAVLAGMNHEMARELLWREYPSDQRGSYFRQFWSVSDNIPFNPVNPAAEKEARLDIKNMHQWTLSLGNNSMRSTPGNVVLVVRGELLKKYPNTVIYAQKAAYNTSNPTLPRTLLAGDANMKMPLFRADIDPDISIFGFDLSPADAKGERITNPATPVAGKNPGWFFVFKERPGQVHFGLDDHTDAQGNTGGMPTGNPADWDDLTWEHLVNNREELETYHLNFSKAIQITNASGQPVWARNAADMAAILLQDPALIARHAGEMLP